MVRVAGVFPLFPSSSRPLIPYKFLECLRPRKPAPGRAEAGIGLKEQGLGALPGLPFSLPAARTGQVPGGERLSSPPQGHQRTVCTRNQRSTAPLLLQRWPGGSLCCGRDAQTPKSPNPSPEGMAGTRTAGAREDVCP